MQDTLTLGQLKKLADECGYSDDTPLVLESFISPNEVVALDFYPVETSLTDGVIMLVANPYETMGFKDL